VAAPRRSRSSFLDLKFAKLDAGRLRRRGFPEAIFAPGKSLEQIIALARLLRRRRQPVFVTRLQPEQAGSLCEALPWLTYFPEARIAAAVPGRRSVGRTGRWRALVVTAGTGDIPAAEEAAATLELSRVPVRRLYDVGVAGLDRLLAHRRWIARAEVIVVAAGMDGALVSVVAGLARAPVIAVPTSIGYGASYRGIAALLTMLNSCSPGVALVNIDNGFGAGVLAAQILRAR